MIYDNTWRVVDLAQLREAVQGKRVFIFGNSRSNDKIFALALGQSVAGIFDNNPSQQGKKANGIPIVAPYYADDIVILTVLADREHLWPQLRQLGYRQWFYIPAPTSRFTQKAAEFLVSTKSDFIPHGHFRYVHIIPDQKFFRPLLRQLEPGFDLSEHAFVVYSFGDSNPNDEYHAWPLYEQVDAQWHNMLLMDGPFSYDARAEERVKVFHLLLDACERVVVHGEFLSPAMQELLHQRRAVLKEKGIMLPWSGAFGYRDFNAANLERALRHCRVIVYKESATPFEKLLSDNILDADIKRLDLRYIDYTVPFKRPEKLQNSMPKVFIGHSCYRDYNHELEVIDLLAKFAGQLEVYCITSYGNPDYIQEVEEAGCKTFGEHFHPMSEFMNEDEYIGFLNQLDAAVFLLTEDAAHTSIRMMAYMGVNFFFDNHTKSYATWTQEGFGVYTFDDIKDDVHIFQAKQYQKQNYERIKAIFDVDLRTRDWQQLLTV